MLSSRAVFRQPYRQLEGLARGLKKKGNFEFLAEQGIEAGIKVRADSNPAWAGPRGEVVRVYLADPDGWKQRVGYGRHWMAETFLKA